MTDAVHAKGGRIVLQLWHVGRQSHIDLQPNGEAPVAPSAIAAKGHAYTRHGEAEFSAPRALELQEIPAVVEEFRSGAQRALRARAKLFDDGGDLLQLQRAGRRELGFAMAGVGVALRGDRGRSDGRFAVGLEVYVRLAAHMPQLQHDASALGVDGVGHPMPALDLVVGIDARSAGVAVAPDRNRRRLGDDQPAFGRALGIVFHHQIARDVAGVRAHSRQRRHDDAVREGIGADDGRREQSAHFQLHDLLG